MHFLKILLGPADLYGKHTQLRRIAQQPRGRFFPQPATLPSYLSHSRLIPSLDVLVNATHLYDIYMCYYRKIASRGVSAAQFGGIQCCFRRSQHQGESTPASSFLFFDTASLTPSNSVAVHLFLIQRPSKVIKYSLPPSCISHLVFSYMLYRSYLFSFVSLLFSIFFALVFVISTSLIFYLLPS